MSPGLYRAVRPMAIGVVHGLAGSAGMTLLLLPIIHDPIWSMAYLVTFGVGTIAGMMLITVIVATPFLYMQTHRHPLRRWMAAAQGCSARPLAFPCLSDRLRGWTLHFDNEMNTERAKVAVRGAVQGVGFRPHVFRLATELQLQGWVLNSSQGVFIEVEGASDRLRQFLLRLEKEKPSRAVIQSLEYSLLDVAGYEDLKFARAKSAVRRRP